MGKKLNFQTFDIGLKGYWVIFSWEKNCANVDDSFQPKGYVTYQFSYARCHNGSCSWGLLLIKI